MGINTKGFAKKNPQVKKPDPKENLERDLKSCMRCKFFYGHNSGCIKNKKCVQQNYKREENKPKEQTKSYCSDCPYGKNRNYCFPCMRRLLER